VIAQKPAAPAGRPTTVEVAPRYFLM